MRHGRFTINELILAVVLWILIPCFVADAFCVIVNDPDDVPLIYKVTVVPLTTICNVSPFANVGMLAM